ncbi:DUF2017 domain-containing protein [Quadrisphaera sp. DSM 44207]|uniref:DUF2017 domain-containing protein n=1 Tax=Quadrisphaera sp. DSM 44207 TaxID=1881057 RepID=UPI00087F9384|nr:DUF2017 domain-containing protein [Quadrisphaera sp. DSM 44207]SDQ07487.1 protein of unknown function [Quadrisphaera sp. DSM 44207]
MARRFERTRRGVGARLDEDERTLLAGLLLEVEDLLDDGRLHLVDPLEALVELSPEATTPTDPALARLLPEAARDDAEAAAEFRRLTEGTLRRRKREALSTARHTLDRPGPLQLDDVEAQAWLTALNDVRLVLATRLELRSDEDAEQLLGRTAQLAPEDPRAWMAAVYDFLTWLQETLVTALTAQLQARPPARGAGT